MNLFTKLKFWINILRIRFHGRPGKLKKAKKLAIRRHLKTGKRYRVFFIAMRYRVYTREEIKAKKRAGIFGSHINSTKIDPHKFFDTNDIAI